MDGIFHITCHNEYGYLSQCITDEQVKAVGLDYIVDDVERMFFDGVVRQEWKKQYLCGGVGGLQYRGLARHTNLKIKSASPFGMVFVRLLMATCSLWDNKCLVLRSGFESHLPPKTREASLRIKHLVRRKQVWLSAFFVMRVQMCSRCSAGHKLLTKCLTINNLNNEEHIQHSVLCPRV